MKNNPSLTREIRTVLEQSLVEKLETLGINAVSSPTLGIFAVLSCLAAPRGLRDLSSPIRDRTWAMAVKAQSPNHWTAREFPILFSK